MIERRCLVHKILGTIRAKGEVGRVLREYDSIKINKGATTWSI